MSIPFIRIMFPEALIIHIKRDPLDTLFSCYATLFDSGNLWTYHPDNLKQYYQSYLNLMARWRSISDFIEISYEELVGQPEEVIHNILEAGGFEWQEECLHFHKGSRSVATASALQVRKPLYKSSIGRGMKFAEYLRDWNFL